MQYITIVCSDNYNIYIAIRYWRSTRERIYWETFTTTINASQQNNNLYTSQQSQVLLLLHRRQAHHSQVFRQCVLLKEHTTQANLYIFPKHPDWRNVNIRYTSWSSLIKYVHTLLWSFNHWATIDHAQTINTSFKFYSFESTCGLILTSLASASEALPFTMSIFLPRD